MCDKSLDQAPLSLIDDVCWRSVLSRAWDRTVAEVDGRFTQDATFQIGEHAGATIAIEEAEAEFAGVLVDAAFTDAGNPARAHQALYP